MKKVLDHVLSLFFYLWFGLVFLGFHVAGLIANAGGHRKSLLRTVEYFCLFIIRGNLILGNSVKFLNDHSLTKGRPLLIVMNHQSLYAITTVVWNKQRHPTFFVAT